MQSLSLGRSVHSVKLMADFAAEKGVPRQVILKGTGLDELQLINPNLLVSGYQELQLIRNLVEQLGDYAGLGIEVGARYHFTTFGAFGIALVSSANVREAIKFALDYFGLTFAFTQFVLCEQQGETRIYVEDEGIPKELRRFIIERDAAALLSVQRDLMPERMFTHLAFSFKAYANLSSFTDFFGVQPLFGVAKSYVVMDSLKIDQPLQLANELVLQASEQQCQQILSQRQSQQSLTSQIQHYLIQTRGHMPSMQAVADQLHLNTRTMRRYLAQEGTSFIQIREGVRQLLADHYLTLPHASVERIAEWLGYSESASFINAYKRWRGNTPHAVRLSQKKQI